MTVEEIQFSQTWDIDDALSENTQNIAISLFAELNQIYELVNQNSTTGMDAHILSIQNSKFNSCGQCDRYELCNVRG